jgi:hypothetical protein
MYERTIDLKKINPSLIILLAVGGKNQKKKKKIEKLID